jgi:hypothetical protein
MMGFDLVRKYSPLSLPDNIFTLPHAHKLPLHEMLLHLRSRTKRQVTAVLLYREKETKVEQCPGNEGELHYFSFTEYKIAYCTNVYYCESL